MNKSQFFTRNLFRAAIFGALVFLCGAGAARAQNIIPHFDCVEPILENGVPTGSVKAHFGYTNKTNNPIVINEGPNNFISPNPSGQYSSLITKTFQPGFHKRSFSIVLSNLSSGSSVSWIVINQGVSPKLDWSSFCGSGMMTFQGRLTAAGAAANSPHDFQFQFYDAVTGGSAGDQVLESEDVPVTNGIFSVQLDVDHAFRNFAGGTRFLEIRVRPANSTNSYVALAPRQSIAAVPFALNAVNAIHAQKIPTFQASYTYSPPPEACTSINIGKMFFHADRLWICNGGGWKWVVLQ